MMKNIEKLIETYGIQPVNLYEQNPKLRITIPPEGSDRNKIIQEITDAKPSIIDFFRKQEYDARNILLSKFPGLQDLEDCEAEWENYHAKINEQFESEDGVTRWPQKPKYTYAELSLQYPIAAAYRMAQSYSCSSNYHKSTAGLEAKKALESGVDYKQVLEDMSHWADNIDIWD